MAHKRDAITVSLDGHGARSSSNSSHNMNGNGNGVQMIDMSSSDTPPSSPKNVSSISKATKRLSRNKVYTLGLACAVCWGIAAVMGKSSLGEIPALILLVVQLIFSNGLLLGLVLWLRPPFPARREMIIFALVGVLQPGLSYALALIGLQMTNVTSETLIWSCETVLIIGLSWVILREPASVKLMLLSGLAVIGVVMVTVSGEEDSDGSHLGDFLIFLGVVCSALDVVLTKGYVDRIDPLWAIALGQFTGLLFSLGLAIFASLAMPQHFWGLGSHHHHGHRIHLHTHHHHHTAAAVIRGTVGPGGAAAVMPPLLGPDAVGIPPFQHDDHAIVGMIPAVPHKPDMMQPVRPRTSHRKKDRKLLEASPTPSANPAAAAAPPPLAAAAVPHAITTAVKTTPKFTAAKTIPTAANENGAKKLDHLNHNNGQHNNNDEEEHGKGVPSSVDINDFLDPEDQGAGEDDEKDDNDEKIDDEEIEVNDSKDHHSSRSSDSDQPPADDALRRAADDAEHHEAIDAANDNNNDDIDRDHDGIDDRIEEANEAKAEADAEAPRRLQSMSSISLRTWLLAGVSGLLQHALPFWLYAIVLTNMPSNMAAFFLTLSPVFGIAGAWWCLGEQLQSGQIWGTLVILASITGVGSMYKE